MGDAWAECLPESTVTKTYCSGLPTPSTIAFDKAARVSLLFTVSVGTARAARGQESSRALAEDITCASGNAAALGGMDQHRSVQYFQSRARIQRKRDGLCSTQ